MIHTSILEKLSNLRNQHKDIEIYYMSDDVDPLNYKKLFVMLDIVDSNGHRTKEPIDSIFCSDEIKYVEDTFVKIYKDTMGMNFSDVTIDCINRFREWNFR